MKVFLYDEGTPDELNLEEVGQYLRQKLGKIEVEARGSPFARIPQDRIADYARRIAGIKVQDLNQKLSPEPEPLHGEIEYEKRRIQGKTKSFGIIYEGFHLQRLFLETIPAQERRLELAHIIFTNRLFASWDESNRRYHLRTSVYSLPSIITTTGLIEAPARPREYYLLKQQYESLGKDLTELKDKFRGAFLDYGDKRLTEVMKGYAMQAVFFSMTGEPFCEDKGCRLYNAHWQSELLFAQLESGYEFCPRHAELLREQVF